MNCSNVTVSRSTKNKKQTFRKKTVTVEYLTKSKISLDVVTVMHFIYFNRRFLG